MIIRRATRSKNFTVVSNAVLEDTRLKEELGVLIYLLSRPDDWKISMTQLQKRFDFGREKMQRVLRTLRNAGYARLEHFHDAAGKWLGNGYVVFEEPIEVEAAESTSSVEDAEQNETHATSGDEADHREPENPSLGEAATESLKNRQSRKPGVVKPGCLLKTDLIPNTDSVPNTPLPPVPGGGEGEGSSQAREGKAAHDPPALEPWEADWRVFDAAYPWELTDRKARAKAYFVTMPPDDRAAALEFAAAYGVAARAANRRILNGQNWLRDRGWEVLQAAQKNAEAAQSAIMARHAGKVWIEAGTPQAAAWRRHHGRSKFEFKREGFDGKPGFGRTEESEWPPSARQQALQLVPQPSETSAAAGGQAA